MCSVYSIHASSMESPKNNGPPKNSLYATLKMNVPCLIWFILGLCFVIYINKQSVQVTKNYDDSITENNNDSQNLYVASIGGHCTHSKGIL